MSDKFKEQLSPEMYEKYEEERKKLISPLLKKLDAVARGDVPEEAGVSIQGEIVNTMYELHIKYGIEWTGW